MKTFNGKHTTAEIINQVEQKLVDMNFSVMKAAKVVSIHETWLIDMIEVHDVTDPVQLANYISDYED